MPILWWFSAAQTITVTEQPPSETPRTATTPPLGELLIHFIKNILQASPNAVLAVITPLHRAVERNQKGETLAEYVEIVRAVAKDHNLPVLDLYDEYGVNPSIPEEAARYMPDGLHPNEIGHTILAEKITAFLENL